MKKDNFYEKITLILSFLILNNYFLLSLSSPELLVKMNFIFFFAFIFVFYFKYFLENLYLKIFFLFIVFICLGVPISDWDPRTTWFFHAKRIFYDKSIFSIADNYAAHSHNDYPTLAPAFASSFASLIGYWNEIFPKLSFTLMFFPPLILIYNFFKDTQYLAFLAIVFYTIGNYLFNGWVDGLVAVYFVLSAYLMYFLIIAEIYHKKSLFLFLIAFCFFAILSLIKNEGAVLLLILFITVFLIKLYKRELRKDIFKLFLLSFSFLPIISWKIFCHNKGIGSEFVNENILLNLLPRIGEIKNYQLISYFLFLNEKFFTCLLFFLITFYFKWNREILIFASIVVVAYSLVLFFIFLSTPHDLYFHLNSTAARVIKSLSFFLAFFGLYNLNYHKIKSYFHQPFSLILF